MEAELEAIERNGTWTLVPRPSHKKVIGVKWVFKTKYLSDGTLDKHKARLVAKGFAQRPGIDFHDTFAPTARMATIRAVLAMAGHRRWPVYQLDVKSAFLNGDLKEEIYVDQPPGFGSADGKVYRLKKALYGLKQAPRAWNKKIDSFLQSKLGYRRSSVDPQLYIHTSKAGCVLFVLYVDDLIITGDHALKVKEMKAALHEKFEMTDMGLLHFFLGHEIY